MQLIPFSLRLCDLCQNAFLCFASRIKGLLDVREFEVNILEYVCISVASWNCFSEYRPLTQKTYITSGSVTPKQSVAIVVIFLLREIIIRDWIFLGNTSFQSGLTQSLGRESWFWDLQKRSPLSPFCAVHLNTVFCTFRVFHLQLKEAVLARETATK